MPVAVPEKTKGSLRWSTFFGKGNKNTDVKHALTNLPREEGVSGAGAKEETDPIQTVAGTGVRVNQPQEPENTSDDQNVIKNESQPATGEGSRAGSERRASDQEIQAVPENSSNRASLEGENDDDSDDEAASVNRIEFYRKDAPYFWLSNSSEHPVYLDGVKYPTAEHLFQSLKFIGHRPEVVSKIRKTSLPTEAIKEARKNIKDVKKGWVSQGGNVAAMREVLLLKFSQHSGLKRQLLLTGDSELVEASPIDVFWGIGSGAGFGTGRNELGKALIRTRETIRAQSGLGIGSGAKTV